MWLTIGVVRVLELFEKGLGLSGESLYVNTWHSQPLFQQSSLTVPHTEPGLMVKHTHSFGCAPNHLAACLPKPLCHQQELIISSE